LIFLDRQFRLLIQLGLVSEEKVVGRARI